MPKPIPAPRDSGYTATTDVPLYWCAYGPIGARRLVVLHGGPGAHHDYLLPQMLELARDYELLFYDQRGGGRSKTDDRTPITWRTHVADLAAVIHELRVSPLEIIGYSWGGLLAMLYAIEASGAGSGSAPSSPDPRTAAESHPPAGGGHPPSPQSLVLIDPAPISRPVRAQFEAEFGRRQQSEAVQRLRAELAESGLRERDPDAYRQRAFELSVAGYFAHPEASHDLTPFRVVGRVQQSVWESLDDFDLAPALARVRIPALVLHGRQDPIPLASSETAARALQARLVVIDESGHVPYVEQPESVFSAIRAFLSETSPAPPG